MRLILPLMTWIALSFTAGCGGGSSAATPSAASASATPASVAASPAATAGPATSGASPQPSPELTVTVGAASGRTLAALYGTCAGPVSSDPAVADVSEGFRRMGVRQVRTHDFFGPFDMAVMYPDKSADPALASSYDFTSSDAIYRSLAAGGFEVYLRLGDSAGMISAPRNAIERANWVRAAVQVVGHYRSGLMGGFRGNIRFVEVWNEPDSPPFWPPPLTPSDYYQLYVETASALKAAYPDVSVGGPGVTQAAVTSDAGKAWLDGFLDRVQAAHAPLDFLSFHLYTDTAQDFATSATTYRGRLDARGLGTVALHCTEYNALPDLRTQAGGAAICAAGWIALQNHGVEQAQFYRGLDRSLTDPAGYGLFTGAGTERPSGQVFALLSQMASFGSMRVVSGGGDLAVLAGSDSGGRVAVLLANPGSSARTVSLLGAASSMARSRVTSAGLQIDRVSSSGITIEARSVTLLVP